MHEDTLKRIVDELDESLPGRYFGRLVQLSSFSLAIDFRLTDGAYLFISVEPAQPRLYLIKRSSREFQKAAIPLSSFAQSLRTTLGGGVLLTVAKDENERVVRFTFVVKDELGDSHHQLLVAQLTGRSANLFLLDSENNIRQTWRNTHGEGQQVGQQYRAPVRMGKIDPPGKSKFETGEIPTSISAAADKYYRELAVASEFDSLAGRLSLKLRKELRKCEKLQANLRQDLMAHGNPEEHKRIGELLLANVATAQREGAKVSLIDYYAEGTPTIQIEVDENETLPEAANAYFSRYSKARRAVEEIGARQVQLEKELAQIGERLARLEKAITARDAEALAEFEEPAARPTGHSLKQKAASTQPGMRRYKSSDGYEVLVGRTARDNDQLTFHVARPNDLWLHAGDYPGSHVIVRNSSRNDIPHRTIIEAAQLAAKFSQASKDTKVNIHYTRRKFLSKPKGSAPGLVRLSSFKTITVEPGENMERIM